MAEEKGTGGELEKRKLNISQICVDTTDTDTTTTGKHASASTPSTPTGLRKSSSGRQNCLCSPTVHPGSFRCRYHRNNGGGGLARSSISVGSRLSELNVRVGSKLSELAGASKPTQVGDSPRS